MKRSKIPLLFVIALPVALAVFCVVSTYQLASEMPDYQIIRADEKFEIRIGKRYE